MTARRLLVVIFAMTWLSPAAMAGAVALHIAFEHHDGHPAEEAHALEALQELAAHGHFHPSEDADHDHPTIGGSPQTAIRNSHSAATQGTTFNSNAERATRENSGRETLPLQLERPPRATGPPLLARLSTLRI